MCYYCFDGTGSAWIKGTHVGGRRKNAKLLTEAIQTMAVGKNCPRNNVSAGPEERNLSWSGH